MNDTVYLVADEFCERLDVFVSDRISELSRSYTKRLIEDGMVCVDGNIVRKASKSVSTGSEVIVNIPKAQEISIESQDIPIDIVYEDKDFAVINKQQGLTTHPANGVYKDTLVNALLYHIKDLSGINGYLRPGIVHRLDKDTSGLMLVAKNDAAHKSLALQIASKECRRIYYGLAEGIVKEDGFVDKPIARSTIDRKKMAVDNAGRNAKTYYFVVEAFKQNTLLKFELTTGRTHQIRVHSKHAGHPIVGDVLYGHKNQRFNLNGQLLHSSEIIFRHPSTSEQMHLFSPLPDYFARILQILRNEKN